MHLFDKVFKMLIVHPLDIAMGICGISLSIIAPPAIYFALTEGKAHIAYTLFIFLCGALTIVSSLEILFYLKFKILNEKEYTETLETRYSASKIGFIHDTNEALKAVIDGRIGLETTISRVKLKRLLTIQNILIKLLYANIVIALVLLATFGLYQLLYNG